jgi:hypothetical protein
MRKDLITVFGISIVLVVVMSFLAIVAGVNGIILTAASLVIMLLAGVHLCRRSRRAAPEVPWACHVAAVIALLVGAGAVVGGLGHSAAVMSLALREPAYGPLQMLRFTTGAILVYSGAMTLAMYPGIKAGRNGAIAVGAASGLLFWLHLRFVLPLPGTGGTVPTMLGMWSIYLLSLGAAFASRREMAGRGQQAN